MHRYKVTFFFVECRQEVIDLHKRILKCARDKRMHSLLKYLPVYFRGGPFVMIVAGKTK